MGKIRYLCLEYEAEVEGGCCRVGGPRNGTRECGGVQSEEEKGVWMGKISRKAKALTPFWTQGKLGGSFRSKDH